MTPNETTRPVCSCCGAIIETDDYYEFDGSILCDDCYHTETVECSHCGDRIWTDDNALIRVMPEDVERTAQMFDLLLGDNLAGRKAHIAECGSQFLDLADIS